MQKNITKRTRQVIALLLAISLICTPVNTVSATSNTILTNDKMQDGTSVSNAEENITYYYDFINNSDLSSGKNGTYGLLTVHGDVKQNSHGPQYSNGTSITLKLSGDSRIKIGYCGYDTAGQNFTVDAVGGTVGELPVFPAKLTYECYEKSGKTFSFDFTTSEDSEEQYVTIQFTSTCYVPSIIVEPIDDSVEESGWKQKSFILNVNGTEVNVTGAESEEGKASISLKKGSVYYAKSDEAFISLDLDGRTLKNSMISNESTDVVESAEVTADGTILVTFKDQITQPSSYEIRLQDTDLYAIPGVEDRFDISFETGTIPQFFTSSFPISSTYTIDNGIVTIGTGTGSKSPYWHGSAHGLVMYNANYFDVKVAGDADITFALCSYSNGGSFTVTNLADGASGSFDTENLKGSTCKEGATYHYEGGATTLRFTLNSSGQNYFHGITVENNGTISDSPVANEQAEMPVIVDPTGSLAINPIGQRLYFSQTNKKASISTLTNLSYYLFAPTTKANRLEADITITEVGSATKNGVFIGMFNTADTISTIATVGVRGDLRVRNVYNKATNPIKPAAGSIDQAYEVGDVIHVEMTKQANGWYSTVTVKGSNAEATIKYTKTELIEDISTEVRFGLAFSNVSGVITNLKYEAEDGTVLYDQTSCYEAIGTLPVAAEIEEVTVSEDRSSIFVKWAGDRCEGDAAYVVEVSTDGGATYHMVSNRVTERSITYSVPADGTYQFRIYGVCGSETSKALVSEAVTVRLPLPAVTLMAEATDGLVELSFTESEGADSYAIYRKSSEESEYELLAVTEELIYTDETVVNETPYSYYVIAQNEENTSNPSECVTRIPSPGHIGQYAYGNEAAEITITEKSNDTVYRPLAAVTGTVDQAGTMALEVNGTVQRTLTVQQGGIFSVAADLLEGRNDVNLYFTAEDGTVTRKTFNFVYLTNYDKIVDASYTGEEGAESEEMEGVLLYSNVQDAVNSVPADNEERVVILVKEGTYTEHLMVSSPYISLIGEDREHVVISFYDSVESPEGGDMTKRPATYVKQSATAFSAENLTFANTYQYLGDGTKSNESADALRVDADHSIFVNVKISGYQDSLNASLNHQYYYKCYITGNVDFIYGSAQALFKDCDIVFRYHARKNSGYVTAPKTSAAESYGFIFADSRVYAEEGCSGLKYRLARPWGADAAASFLNCYISGVINTEAPYADMSGNLAANARFYEFYTYGEGFAFNDARRQISANQAAGMQTVSSLGWDAKGTTEELSSLNYIGAYTAENVVTVEKVPLQDAGEIKDLVEQDANNTDAIVLTITSGRTNGSPVKTDVTSLGVKPGDRIYVYEYNEKTGKLYSIYKGYSYRVTEDGMAEITVANSGTYVIVANQPTSLVMKSIPWQTWVGLNYSVLYLEGEVGRTRQLAIHLPQSIVPVEELNDVTSSVAAGGVMIEYSSADESVAVVSADGVITPKALGKTTITIKFTYSYGKVKVVTKDIVVKQRRK